MTISDWIGLAAVLLSALGGLYAIVMTAVDRKIGVAIGKMRDERLREVTEEKHRLEEKVELLRERIKDMK